LGTRQQKMGELACPRDNEKRSAGRQNGAPKIKKKDSQGATGKREKTNGLGSSS